MLFATHFKEIASAFDGRPGFANLHLHTQVKNDQIIAMSYQLKDGVVSEDHYGPPHPFHTDLQLGIRLAKLSTLPDSVITRATQVSGILTARARQRNLSSRAHILTERRRLILQLHETLRQAAGGSMDDEGLARWLQRVQSRFVDDFDSLE